MLTRFRIALMLIPSVVAIYASRAAAEETTGRLEGSVVDAKSAPIAFADVVATSPALQGVRGMRTDTDGRFLLIALPVGDYAIKVSDLAHQVRTIADVHVRLNQTTTIGTIQLQDRVIPMEQVEVSGHAPLLDPRSTVLGENLAARDFEALPIQRDYKSVAVLLPHANASPLGDPVNFAGATGLENRYFVDGVDVTDPFRNATGTGLPSNFVQEVQVRTGGYEAECRSSLGGTVNAVTYSGGNTVSGQMFGFFTSNGLSATPRSIPSAPNAGRRYALYDAGFGIGGPLRRDRLWYYAAYNPSFSKEDVAIPGWSTYQDHSSTHSFAGKLTWRADSRNTFVLTGVGDPSDGRLVTAPLVAPAAVDPFLFTTRNGGVSLVLEGRHFVSDRCFVQTTVSHSNRVEESTPETEAGRTQASFVDSLGVVSGGGTRSKNESGVTSAALQATWIAPDHEVKAGLEYRDTGLDFDIRTEILQQSSATLYYYQLSSFKGHVGSRLPSAYLQHTWRPSGRWTLNDGLRWDGQYWISSEKKVAQTILDEWQPRLGVIYQPGTVGTQKIYVSVGRFYQDLTTSPLFWYYNRNSSFFSATYDHDPRTAASGADTTAYFGGAIQAALVGLEGQFFDEVTAGYERQMGPRMKIGLRGVERVLRQGIEDGVDAQSGSVGISNPGLGALRAFPPMSRRYSALELTCQGQVGRRVSLLASYVLSRNRGNFEGLFDSRLGNPYPNTTGLYDFVQQMFNATGLLPNDHAHVLKIAASAPIGHGFTVGAVGVAESGMPVSEFGATNLGFPYFGFLGARGSHGRTPSVWDLNLRVGYEPAFVANGRWHPRFSLDAFHLASPRKPVRYDDVHYRLLDSSGNQIDPNPTYRMPTAYQPPMAVRLGMEVGF